MNTEKTALIHARKPGTGAPQYIRVAFPSSSSGLDLLTQEEFLAKVVGRPRLKVIGYSKLLGTPEQSAAGPHPSGVGVLVRMQEVADGPMDLEFPFVLYYDVTTSEPPTTASNLGQLQRKWLDDGWSIVCQETLAEERAHGLTFVLIKLHKRVT